MERRKQFNTKSFFIKYALFVLILALWVVYGIKSPYFFTIQNIKSLLVNATPLLIYATGMTYILILGEIDLSIGSIGAVSGAIWILSMTQANLPLFVAFCLAVCVGATCGVVNAILIVKLKINAFMVTLGMQFLLRGLCYFAVGGEQILTPATVHDFAQMRILTISPVFYIGILTAVIMMGLYKYTSFGRKVQACGCNKHAAAMVGVNVNRTRFLAFVICGALAGLAGAFQVVNIGMVNPNSLGDGSEFLAITACVLGGTSLLGGIGSIVPGTFIGVIFYYSIENGLGLMGANVYIYPIVRGIVIFLAMVTDSLKRSIGVRKETV